MPDLNVIRTITIKGTAEGTDKVIASLGQIVDKTEDVTIATEEQVKATLSAESAYKKLQTQLDSQYRSQLKLEQAEKVLNQARNQGLTSLERQNELLQLAQQRFTTTTQTFNSLQQASTKVSASFGQMNNEFGKLQAGLSNVGTKFTTLNTNLNSLGGGGGGGGGGLSGTVTARLGSFTNQLNAIQNGAVVATRTLGQMGNQFGILTAQQPTLGRGLQNTGTQVNNFGSSTKAARYEMLNFGRQVADVGVGLASGQSLFIVAIQQGTQIADAFQVASLAGRNLAKDLLALITPFRVLVTVILAAAGAAVALELSLANTEKQLQLLSQRVDTPVDKLRALQQIAVPHLTFDEFIKTIDEFAAGVDRAKLGLGSLAQLFRLSGKPAGDLVQDLLNVADILQNAASNQQRFRILQEAGLPATQGVLKFLMQGRDVLQEQLKTLTDQNTRTEELGRSAIAFNEAWAKAWDNFKRNAQDAVDAVLGFFGKLLRAANDFVLSTQRGLLSLRGFTPEQALRRQGEQELATGGGTRLDTEGASKFYESIRGAANEGAKLKISVSGTVQDTKELLQLDSRRIQLLGNLATTEDAVRQKSNEIKQALIDGVNLRADEIAKLKEIARLEDIAKKAEARVSVLGESATQAERYDAAVKRLQAQLADTTITQSDYNRKLAELAPIIGDLEKNFGNFLNTFVQGMLEGKNATEALAASLQQVGSQIASGAFQDVGKQLSKSINEATGPGLAEVFGAAGSALGGFAGPLGSAAVGVGISLISKLFSNEDAQKNAQAAEQASQAFTQARDALDNVTKSFLEFTKVAEGPVASAIENAQNQFQQVVAAGQAAQRAAFTAFASPGATPAQQGLAFLGFQQAQQQIDAANQALKEFDQRTIDTAEAALRGTDALSDTQKQIQDLRKQAEDLNAAMRKLGTSAEDARAAVEDDLAVALARLANQIQTDLMRQINELQGKSFINDLVDLFQTISDAQSLGVDPTVVGAFLALKAQDIVNSAKLTGDAFNQMLQIFPQLTGVVTEFVDVAGQAADDAAKRAQSLQDRLFAATTDTSTLAGQLAAFDREANKERADEIAAGGQNIALLEQVLAAERLNIITKFNDDVIAEEKRAADERAKAIEQASKNIMDYLNSLLVGPESALSPGAKLQAAQSIYNAQLALAQGGDLEALQNITKFAEDLRKAAQEFYGSAAGYQNVLGTIQTQLGALPRGGTGGFAGKDIAYRAYGGPVGTDIIPAMLTPGEFVVRRSVALANARNLVNFNTTGTWPGANDNAQTWGRIEGLLSRIATLQESGNEAIDRNTQATVGQTSQLNREQRFTARKQASS